jgi:hypothetical protein
MGFINTNGFISPRTSPTPAPDDARRQAARSLLLAGTCRRGRPGAGFRGWGVGGWGLG